tara:strand:+ start:328 stop:1959 length:1632 start_codon:yes stop_codon:yes gene_type:complete
MADKTKKEIDAKTEALLEDALLLNTDSDLTEKPQLGDTLAPKLLDSSALKSAITERNGLYDTMVALHDELRADAVAGKFDAEKDAKVTSLGEQFDAVDAQLQAHNAFEKKLTAQQAAMERRAESLGALPKEIRNKIAGQVADSSRFDSTLGTSNVVERNRIANAAVQGFFKGNSGFVSKITKFEREAMDTAGVDYQDREGLPVQLMDTKSFKNMQRIFFDAVGVGRESADVDRRRAAGRDRFVDALSTETGGGGPTSENYLFGTEFITSVEEAMLAVGELRQVIDIMRTPTGIPYYWPTWDDTANAGEMLAESLAEPSATTVTFADPSVSRMRLDAHKGGSKAVVVSHELLRDNAVGLAEALPGLLGTRLGRLSNNKYTLGTGTTMPDGIVPESTLGKTVASNAAITFLELIDLVASVEYGIISSKTCRFMFNYATKMYLRKAVDSQNRPLWQIDYRSAAPSTIFEHEYVVNQDMASIATVAKSVLFGNLNAYKAREVQTIRTRRLQEIRALQDQEIFVSFLEFDGRLLDAGDNPVKHIIHPV